MNTNLPKVIICIHGRSNKPKKSQLKRGWKKSINEGLEKNNAIKLRLADFDMSYYADIYYSNPVEGAENNEPYRKAELGSITFYNHGALTQVREIVSNWLDTPFDWLEEHSHLFSTLARRVSKKLLKDVGEYYANPSMHKKINHRLKNLLLAHQQSEIILISHSMGTVIAYEVLRQLGKPEQQPNFLLAHFITLGSPLGLTMVKGNIIDSHKKLRTPSCVKKSWVNFSDPNDLVCLDTHLADDYASNHVDIKVKDILVNNDYPNNSHKSYGYLRTPEFSQHLARLLSLL